MLTSRGSNKEQVQNLSSSELTFADSLFCTTLQSGLIMILHMQASRLPSGLPENPFHCLQQLAWGTAKDRTWTAHYCIHLLLAARVGSQRRHKSAAMLYLFSASSACSRAAILWFRFPTVVPGGSSPIQPQAEGKGWLLSSVTLLRISLSHCADSCFQDSTVTRPLLDVVLCCSFALSLLMSACKECRLPV